MFIIMESLSFQFYNTGPGKSQIYDGPCFQGVKYFTWKTGREIMKFHWILSEKVYGKILHWTLKDFSKWTNVARYLRWCKGIYQEKRNGKVCYLHLWWYFFCPRTPSLKFLQVTVSVKPYASWQYSVFLAAKAIFGEYLVWRVFTDCWQVSWIRRRENEMSLLTTDRLVFSADNRYSVVQVNNGQWIMDNGTWTMNHGQWIINNGLWTMDHEQ